MKNKYFKNIEILSQNNAEEIANNWTYNGKYSFYDMKNDIEDYEEIISTKQRNNNYFQVMSNNGEITAFFCLDFITKDKVEIGLGIRPDLTSKGLGIILMNIIEDYIKYKTDFKVMLLSVVDFNQRAIKVYEKAGFKKIGTENNKSNGGVYKFIILSKNII